MSQFLAFGYLNQSLRCTSQLQNFIKSFKYQLHPLPVTKTYATNAKVKPSDPPGPSNDEWRTIYHLPLIRLASSFNRVKVPYGIFNAVVIPASYLLEQSSQLPPTTAILISTVGLTSWCTLAITSLFVRNLIGLVYINDSNDKIKLAYVDYWGKRIDVDINLDDVISESRNSKFDFYQPLSLHGDSTVKYKLLPRFGRIDEPETFTAIFGE